MALRTSNERMPFFVMRSTVCVSCASSAVTASASTPGWAPAIDTTHSDAWSRSPSGAFTASATSSTTKPCGSTSFSASITLTGLHTSLRPSSTYSASEAADVGAAFA